MSGRKQLNHSLHGKLNDKGLNSIKTNSSSEFVQGASTRFDAVANPIGYTHHKIEVIDFIEDQDLCLHLGIVVQYICRERYKGGLEDLKKAQWYLNRYIQKREREQQ